MPVCLPRGECTHYTELATESTRVALERLTDTAKQNGANAVLNVKVGAGH